MTVKVLGAGSVNDDPIGLLGDTLGDLGHDLGNELGHDLGHEVDALELLEFLAADLEPVSADPVFQKQLADLLWEMVREGRWGRPRDH